MRLEKESLCVIIAVCIGYSITPLSISAVNVVVPAIAREFELDAVLMNSIPAFFIFSNTSMILPAGRMADSYGRKAVFISGMFILIGGSLLCLFTPNLFWLLLGRLIQGVGAACVFSSGLALLVSAVPKSERGVYIGFVAACVYVGLSSGPLIGGWLESNFGWRSVFFILIPFALLIVILLKLTVQRDWRAETKLPIDVSGGICLAAVIASVLVGMSLIDSVYGWGVFVFGALAAWLFVRLQKRRSSPLIRLDLLRQNHALLKGVICSFCMYSVSYPLIFLMALYLQYVFTFTALQAGTILFWQTIAMTLAALTSGRLAKRFTEKRVAMTGTILFLSGLCILGAVLHQGGGTSLIAPTLMLIGFGFGLFTSPNNTMGLSLVPDERIGGGSGLLNFARTAGNIFGTGIVILCSVLLIGKVEITADTVPAFVRVTLAVMAIGGVLVLVAVYTLSRQRTAAPVGDASPLNLET